MKQLLDVIVCLLAIGCCPLRLLAQSPPRLLPFQGRLTDQNGVAVSNGASLVQFKIFELPTGGSPVWAGELHRTTVNGGLVNVVLGSKTPFTGVDFDRQLYLEIIVDINGDNAITPIDPPMLPRQTIHPVVFAKESADSRLLDGFDWKVLFGTNNPATGTISDARIRDRSIVATKLESGTITSNELGDASVDMQKLSRMIAEALNPPGAIIAFGGLPTVIPPGWLLCDGSSVRRSDYPRLFTTIGTSWGSIDASSFNLPDLRGRVVVGAGSGGIDMNGRPLTVRQVGQHGGEEVHQLSLPEMPDHNHDYWDIWHSENTAESNQYVSVPGNRGSSGGDSDNVGHQIRRTSFSNGGGTAHNIMQPFGVVNFLIKY